MATLALPSRRPSPRRIGAARFLMIYACPALLLCVCPSPDETARLAPLLLAFAHAVAMARRAHSPNDILLLSDQLASAAEELKRLYNCLVAVDEAKIKLKTEKRRLKIQEMNRKKQIFKPCTFPDCDKKATHGYRYGEGDRCEEHREDRPMQYRMCTCGKAQPSFNFPDEISAMYCAACRKDGMVNIISKRCACGATQPTLNYPGEEKPLYCSKCRKDGMVNVLRDLCKKCGKATASFAEPGESKPVCCGKCKTETMINLVCRRCVTCSAPYPSYNYENERTPRYCWRCKTSEMINLSKQYCPGAQGTCTSWWNPKYDGHCTHCFVNMFPGDPRVHLIHKKSKELQVRDYINEHFKGFRHDEPMEIGKCECPLRRRVDHRCLFNNTLLAVETDEEQHKFYDKKDENDRYDDLYMAYSGKWIYIRFNPDKYKDRRGVVVNPPMAERLEALGRVMREQIRRAEKYLNTEKVEIIYMYYDEA